MVKTKFKVLNNVYISAHKFYSDKWMFSEQPPKQKSERKISTYIKNSFSSMKDLAQDKDKFSFGGSFKESCGKDSVFIAPERNPPVTFSIDGRDDVSLEEEEKYVI